ncbi:MAG: helix-turn-helix domain-containing protein [Rhodobacteraceae bacterium]|nr:helix-turn-helix domain-containing protein [Paracoccaceae bacterium]
MNDQQSSGSAARLIAIPRLAAGGRWRVEAMRSVSEPLLLWFTRGQGRITVGGVTRGYGTHNAIFIPAGTMHGFEASQHVFGSALFFGADCDLPLPTTAQHLRIRETAAQMELTALLDTMQREMDGAKPGQGRAVHHHLGLLSVWIERQAALQPPEAIRPDAARRLAQRFSALLERDFRSGQGVADYAAALEVTPTHLSRVCRQACGRPASSLLQDRVLFEARRLLVETRMPVNEVSRSLGFTSAAYFTRAFQHRTGKTPTAFRKSV